MPFVRVNRASQSSRYKVLTGLDSHNSYTQHNHQADMLNHWVRDSPRVPEPQARCALAALVDSTICDHASFVTSCADSIHLHHSCQLHQRQPYSVPPIVYSIFGPATPCTTPSTRRRSPSRSKIWLGRGSLMRGLVVVIGKSIHSIDGTSDTKAFRRHQHPAIVRCDLSIHIGTQRALSSCLCHARPCLLAQFRRLFVARSSLPLHELPWLGLTISRYAVVFVD